MNGLCVALVLSTLLVACDRTPVNPASPSSPVPAVVTAAPSTLEIESFTVTEYRYPNMDAWNYAPKVRVRETSGAAAVDVTLVVFAIGTSHGVVPITCHIGAGESVELFPEIYGDYATYLTMARVTGESTARVQIATRDADRRSSTLTGTTAIVSGGLPASAIRGVTPNRCSPAS